MNFEVLAAELIRQVRGKRSQNALSRRLGYRTNVVYTWEAGRRWPTASKFLFALTRTGFDLDGAVERFYGRRPAFLRTTRLATPAGVAALLGDLRGGTAILHLARRADRSRFAVSRWLKGQAEPNLPDFLRMIEASSLRLLDFLAELMDLSKLPAVAGAWAELQAARRAAYDLPWSHAVLRVLELPQYRALPRHERGFIATRLGIPPQEEERCLRLLSDSGQIRFEKDKWVLGRILTVDTRHDPEAGRRLKMWWAHVALERMSEDTDGLFSYNLFTVSEKDYGRLRELHLSYFRELRSIVAQSEPAERVVLANVQLLPLEPPSADR